MNASGHVIESGSNVDGKARKGQFQLLREAVLVAVFDGKIKGEERVELCAAELREHAQAFARSRSDGLVARGN